MTASPRAQDDQLEQAWADIQPPVARRLMIAAVQEFSARGYHATTTRDIASRAGLSPAGVYVHFRSKEELLFRICLTGHRHALQVVRHTTSDADPVRRLRELVSGFAAWHATYHTPARVISYEMAALTEEHRAELSLLRREIDAVMRDCIESGAKQGVFTAPDVAGAAMALLSLAIDVARWYHPGGQRTPAQIGELYAGLAERMLRG
jgi:AcrR family transcriptional regulator